MNNRKVVLDLIKIIYFQMELPKFGEEGQYENTDI